MKLTHLYRSVMKNYSLLRAYENDFVQALDISGKGLDLGAKSSDAKYYEYLDMSKVSEMEYVDYFHSGPNIIKMDLDKVFPIDSDKYDFVLTFNVMEHLYNFQQFVSETHRVLKPEGRMHGLVPMMWHFHPDPNDYFRYTIQGLERMMTDAGYTNVNVIPIAAGPFKVAGSQVAHVIRIRLLRFLGLTCAMGLDNILGKVSKGNNAFALGYYFTGTKQSV